MKKIFKQIHLYMELTFEPGWYLNSSTWFKKNILFQQEEIKL